MPQNWVMMGLGIYRFSMATAAYQELLRTTQYTWPVHQRAGATPLLQFTGGGNDEIALRGIIFPEFNKVGTRQIDEIRLEAGLGTPLPLISGFGNFYGMFAIAAINEEQTFFWADGTPKKQGFTIALIRYNDLTLTVPGTNLTLSASGLIGAAMGG